MKNSSIHIIAFCLPILLMAGCREEIVSPDNPVYNVNEPVKQSFRNSYSFSVNAQNLSLNQLDQPDLTSGRTRATFNVDDYNSGRAVITITSIGAIIYQGQFDENFNNFIQELTGAAPIRIRIVCEDFTGKLRVHLSSI